MPEDPQCQHLRNEIGNLRSQTSENLAKFQEKSREVIAGKYKVDTLIAACNEKQNDVATLRDYLGRVRADAEQHPTDFGKTRLLGEVEGRYNAAVAELSGVQTERNNEQSQLGAITERMNALSADYQSSLSNLNAQVSQYHQRSCPGEP